VQRNCGNGTPSEVPLFVWTGFASADNAPLVEEAEVVTAGDDESAFAHAVIRDGNMG